MIEIEVKLAVSSRQEAEHRLRAAGAREQSERLFEDNRLYDDPADSLQQAGRVLRLRRFGERSVVTFKAEPTPSDAGERYKIREEHETTVDNLEAVDAILTRLGFQVRWRYQKWRQQWALAAVAVELDETPIGVFLELEGEPDAIDLAAKLLGFSSDDYLTSSYRELAVQRRGSDRPGDLVFESNS